jgi:hypothetical protein
LPKQRQSFWRYFIFVDSFSHCAVWLRLVRAVMKATLAQQVMKLPKGMLKLANRHVCQAKLLKARRID